MAGSGWFRSKRFAKATVRARFQAASCPPCESDPDTGHRGAFGNAAGAVAMTPDFARAVCAAEGCAPVITDPVDPTLRALHTRLVARAYRLAATQARRPA